MRGRRFVVAAVVALCLAWAWTGTGCYRSAKKEPAPPAESRTPISAESGASSLSTAAGMGQENGKSAEPAWNEPAREMAPSESVVSGDSSGTVPLPLPAKGAPSSETGTVVPEAAAVPPGEGGALDFASGPTGSGERPSDGFPETEKRIARKEMEPVVPKTSPKEGRSFPVAEELPVPEDAPLWVREREELVYRVEFLGLTMGYAQFRVRGMVRIGDRVAYRLTVRAWTTDLLSVFYPMNDTIDYYLDVETLAPIRQEFNNSRKEDDIAYYDQQTGKIVYRYTKTGKIRKEVDAVPGVYDPVSVAYYFRTRELVNEEPARHMYAGRKLWEISAKTLGVEKIRTDQGLFDTVMIEPVIRRNGHLEHKGNLRVWMTRDERHVPVRLYAKFKKIRTWTLVGELVPGRQGG